MNTYNELIAYYEALLEKVKGLWGNDTLRGEMYIQFAEGELEAVRNGREW